MFNALDKPFLDYTQEKNKNTRVKTEEIISCIFFKYLSPGFGRGRQNALTFYFNTTK